MLRKLILKENLIISTLLLSLFFLFVINWSVNSGAYIWGLYSEVDGQHAAWLSKFLIEWGSPFDMNSLNPFQGVGTIFAPVNPWWNLGALALKFSNNALINFIISYSIYWLEIFFGIYLLARTSGLTKIESILAAEAFVLFLFPPFTEYFKTLPWISLTPMYAHWITIYILIIATFIKLGKMGVLFNLLFLLLLIFEFFFLAMTGGFHVIPGIPIFGLFTIGLILQNNTRKDLAWKISGIFLLAFLFFVFAYHYYHDTTKFTSAALNSPSKGTYSSIFFAPSRIFFLHILSLFGGLVGIFYQRGKYKWIAISFIIIVLIPDTAVFIFSKAIIPGSISMINPIYYLWYSYPLYVIFFIILISFLGHLFISFFSSMNVKINSFYLKLISLVIIPLMVAHIGHKLSKHRTSSPQMPARTAIIDYLQNKIGLNPGDVFKGTTMTYFGSEGSLFRSIIAKNNTEHHFRPEYYIQTREFLNQRFKNRYMYSDVWNFNIPTLEEYAQFISLPMAIFFRELLSEEGDEFDRNHLNVYKLNLNVLRALGVRFVISDKVLNDKNLTLVLQQEHVFVKHAYGIPNEYGDYKIFLSSRSIFEKLQKKYNNDFVSNKEFRKEFYNELDKVNDQIPQNKDKVRAYFEVAINSIYDKKQQEESKFSNKELEKIKQSFDRSAFYWISSPPLYLYAIKNPNLANFSPTHVIQINSGKALFKELNKANFSFEKSVIIQYPLSRQIINQLIPAKFSVMQFENNAVHVRAQSDQWSILLLPLQYSHCYSLIEMIPSSSGKESPQLMRANLIQTALLFKGKIDIKLNFEFGIGKNMYCRQKDIQDIKNLGL